MSLKGESTPRSSQIDCAFLLRLMESLCSLGDPAEIRRAAALCLAEHLGVARVRCWTAPGDEDAGPFTPAALGSELLERLRSGETLVLNGVTSQPALRNAGIASAMLAGHESNGRLSALSAESPVPRTWAPHEIAVLRETAIRTAHAIARAHALQSVSDEALRQAQHGLKNDLQLVISLMNLQANEIDDRYLLGIFENSRNRVHALAAIYEVVNRMGGKSGIALGAYAEQLLSTLQQLHDAAGRLNIHIDANAGGMEPALVVPFGLLLNELLTLARTPAAFPQLTPSTTITVRRERDHIALIFTEDQGLPDFASLGVRLVHMFAQQLGGHAELLPPDVLQVRFPSTENLRDHL
jgi:two-component sensor histidine kinase